VDTSMLERRPAPEGDMRSSQRDRNNDRGNRSGGPPDLSAAAKKLGISERELHKVMRSAGAP
jgi:hypothetical protein